VREEYHGVIKTISVRWHPCVSKESRPAVTRLTVSASHPTLVVRVVVARSVGDKTAESRRSCYDALISAPKHS